MQKVTFLLLQLTICTSSVPILLFTAFPHHEKLFHDIAGILRSADHQPYLISYSFSNYDGSAKCLPDIHLNSSSNFSVLVDMNSKNYNFLDELSHIKLIFKSFVNLCDQLLLDANLISILQSKEFKLAIVDLYFNDVCSLVLARKLALPVIGVWPTAVGLPLAFYAGLPTFPSFNLATGSGFEVPMKFQERFANSFSLRMEMNEWNDYFYTSVLEVVGKHYHLVPSVSELYKDISVIFANHDPLLDYVRPSLPYIIYLGGFHCRLPTALSKDINAVTKNYSLGIVYISMEYELYSTFPEKIITALEETAIAFPRFLFIWNYTAISASNKSSNILPANENVDDILGHSRTRLFISTCDRRSVFSALFHGVPSLCIPLTAHEWENAKLLNKKGAAILVEKWNITVSSTIAAFQTIVKNKNYSNNARKLSALFRDKPEAPEDLFLYWVNYIIRHKTAPHLKSVSQQDPVYLYYNLDVLILLLIFIFVSLIVLLGLLYCLYTHEVIQAITRKRKRKSD